MSFELQPVVSSAGSLKMASGDCLPSKVNGSFLQGAAVSDSNYLEVDIQVTAIGAYKIVSDTVNGVRFKAEGTFTATGINSVRLRSYGTPLLAGTFPFAIKYINSVCTIHITVTDASASPAVFKYVGGTGDTCMGATVSGTYTTGKQLDASNTVSIVVNATKPGPYSINTTVTNGISFAGSGMLSTTGNHVIVLTASGNPTTSGKQNIAPNGSNGCTFQLTVLPAVTSTAAVYSLGSAGGACTGVTLSGSYKPGVAMTSANTAKIDVTVTTAGTYNISTAAINGVTFSGTGAFTATGAQQVTLTASGTPTAGGNHNYGITANGNTCTFPLSFLTSPTSAAFTMSGAPGNCTTPVINGSYVVNVPMNTGNTAVVKVDVTTAGVYSLTTDMINGIRFSKSGVFNSTGTGIEITLTATGTPLAAGTNTITPQAGNSTCTFDVLTRTVAAGVFTCKIDGVAMSFYDGADAEIDNSGLPYLYLNGHTGPPTGSAVPDFEVFITNLDNSPVKAGSYNVDGFLLPKGYMFEVYYNSVNPDGSAIIWSTSSSLLGPNPPFTVTVSSVGSTRVRGTFSGKLTNMFDGSTMQKTVTDGIFDLPIR